MKSDYDIIIIGAGPAGLSAGLRILTSTETAQTKPAVLIVEKFDTWNRVIPCAEGAGKLGLEEVLGEIDSSWVRHVVKKVVFHSPCGASVAYTHEFGGYILDRAKMQRDLADRLKNFGAHIKLGERVAAVSGDGLLRSVTFDNGETVTARVVIDASGPHSKFGAGEGLVRKIDVEPAYFAVAENVDCGDAVHLYMGQKIAPGGGYAWVFPRGERSANIGIVIGRNRERGVNLKTLLENFLRENFPNAQVKNYFAGSIPCGYERGDIARLGLIKCGDAANTVNPISRAGISEAFISGKLAGGLAVEMLGASGNKKLEKHAKKICSNYEKAWFEKRGASHKKLAKVKGALSKIPDVDYDRAAVELQKMSEEKVTPARIFTVSLKRFPRLVWAIRYLL